METTPHFRIYVDDPQRAIDFYRNVFSWEARKHKDLEDCWLVSTETHSQAQINGTLIKRNTATLKEGRANTVCTIDVNSIYQSISKIIESGGKVVKPKTPVPYVGWLAYCKDTEGNTFSIIQSEEEVYGSNDLPSLAF